MTAHVLTKTRRFTVVSMLGLILFLASLSLTPAHAHNPDSDYYYDFCYGPSTYGPSLPTATYGPSECEPSNSWPYFYL